ncbi:MAG: STAS domain-containing protein [Phycisphaerae bacterium]|nr:STAS domain-containing protein [Phycisphaerae bacterium]
MSVEQWSENILLVDFQDDPLFSDDLATLIDQFSANPNMDVVINLAQVAYLNSSNIASLLKLRKLVCVNNHRKLILCGVSTHVWGVFLVTGLEKVFEFADDVAMGLTSVQIDAQA